MNKTQSCKKKTVPLLFMAAVALSTADRVEATTVTLTAASNTGPWVFNTATNTFTANPAIGNTVAIDGVMSGPGNLLLQPADPNNAVRFVDINAAATYTGITRLRSVDARFGVRLGVNNAFPTSSSVQFETTNQGSGRPVWMDLNGFSQQLAGIGHTGANYNAIVNGNASQAGSLIVSNNNAVTYSSLLGADNAHPNITANATGIPDGSGNNFSLTKSGTAILTLTRANSYTGDTMVEQGTLSIQNAYLSDAANVRLTTGGNLELDFSGNNSVQSLFLDGVPQAPGIWGASGSGADNESTLITGTGFLDVAQIPEPSGLVMMVLGGLGLALRRRRS